MRCMPMAILVASLPAILAGFVATAAEPSPSAAVDTAFPGETRKDSPVNGTSRTVFRQMSDS